MVKHNTNIYLDHQHSNFIDKMTRCIGRSSIVYQEEEVDNDPDLHIFYITFHLGARKISIVNTRNQRFIILDELFTKR